MTLSPQDAARAEKLTTHEGLNAVFEAAHHAFDAGVFQGDVIEAQVAYERELIEHVTPFMFIALLNGCSRDTRARLAIEASKLAPPAQDQTKERK